MACCSVVVKAAFVGVIGLLLLISGIILLYVVPSATEKKIAGRLAINNGSDSFKLWQKSPVPYTLAIHLFHVENPADIIKGKTPKLAERGPFIYRLYKEKIDIDFDDDMDTVSFRGKKKYVFSPEESNGSLSDQITMLNVPLLGVSKTYKTLSPFDKTKLNFVVQLYGAKPFVTKNVSQMLFEGYEDRFIKYISEKKNMTILPNNTFGFLYRQNESSNDGLYTVYRGNQDISKIMKIVSINNKTSLPFWGTPYCNMFNGTDGTQFAPPIRKNEKLYIYTPELCRSVYLRYNKDVIVNDIRLNRFELPDELFKSPMESEENKCFCVTEKCFYSGVIPISTCRKGAPIIVSLPHFYQADESFLNATEGLEPHSHLHEIFLDVEPNTGIIMNAAKRLQMNADVRPVPGMVGYVKMPSVVFPLLWVSESATISTTSAEKFKSQLLFPIMVTTAVTYGLIGVGVFMLICLIIYIIVTSLRKKPKTITGTNHSGVHAASENGPAAEKLLMKPVFS